MLAAMAPYASESDNDDDDSDNNNSVNDDNDGGDIDKDDKIEKYVYVATQAPQIGISKIGQSKNPSQRMKTLRGSDLNPYILRAHFKLPKGWTDFMIRQKLIERNFKSAEKEWMYKS